MIRYQVSKLRPLPDTLILNAGKWPHHFFSKTGGKKAVEKAKQVRYDLYKATTEELDIRNVIWKTTTSSRGGIYNIIESETDRIMCSLSSSSSSSSSSQQRSDTKRYVEEKGGERKQQKQKLSFGCLNVSYWTKELNASYYVDEIHFIEPIYRQMNEQLFEMLNIPLLPSSSSVSS